MKSGQRYTDAGVKDCAKRSAADREVFSTGDEDLLDKEEEGVRITCMT